MEEARDKKKWIGIFAAFFVVIAGLLIAIVIIVVNRNNVGNVQEEPTRQEENQEAETEKTEADEIYEQTVESINLLLEETNAEDTQQIFATYNEYIDAATDEEAKNRLKLDYYQMAMLYDTEKEKKDEIVNALLEIDKNLANVKSAAVVMNAASYYDDNDLYEQYGQILRERQVAEGLDLSLESRG